MRILLFLIIVGLFIYWCIRSSDWLDSGNPFKFWAGCLTWILLFLFIVFLNILGFFKECSSHSNNSDDDIDYYDAPR